MEAKTLLAVGSGQHTRTPRHICGAHRRTICLIIAQDYRFMPCAYEFVSSRRPNRRQRQRPAAYARRLHRNFWPEQVISLVVPYVQRFTLVRSVQRPAKPSRRFELENRRFLALRRRRAHATAPTTGRRGAPSRTSMRSTARARCIRCAWRLGRAGPARPKRDFT
jgi:hypothetical protein